MKNAFFNIFFRGITLLSKFVFIIFLGKYSLDETNLGIFGLLSTSVALIIYLIGFDFYVFNTREIINRSEELVENLRNQLFFHSIAYVVILPLSLFLIFSFGFVSIEYLWVFLFLVISEHLGQELFRLFTTLEMSIKANIMLFLRSGLWIWFVLFDFFILLNPIDLKRYIIFWAISSWFSFVIFVIYILFNVGIKDFTYKPPNWRWILMGFKTASFFFVGSISFMVIQLSDRFMIDYFYGKKLVGIYTAYAQFTNAIDVFTFSAISMVAFPKMVKTFSNIQEYNKVKTVFLKQLVLITTILIAIVYLVAPIIFNFLDKKSILTEISTFHVLLAGGFLLIISNVFHYDLYVKKKDSLILKIAVFGMLINIILNLILIPIYDILGASLSTLSSFLIIFILKVYFSNKTSTLHDSI